MLHTGMSYEIGLSKILAPILGLLLLLQFVGVQNDVFSYLCIVTIVPNVIDGIDILAPDHLIRHDVIQMYNSSKH